ncbi:response regulator transcription factor [Salsipaludibacter albus]|uniref:response regulator transcription factor n=1 Tax=Salsipaludibacter albus TaxID=2849650 RepID=UPI001EE4AEDF|nr:response regulator transcription factor [Salsipaludibacter albus]MBY5163982.1 response regulator transcription factor [Salsipaludibacter albus]
MDATPPRTATVAVVDDEAMVRDVTGRYLRDAGFTVVEYDDGDTALRGLRAEPVDLVVLDVMLPGRNGWEVLKELRVGSSVPVIMLTARGGEAERVGGLELGADDYVTKPFSPRELVARVRTVLRRTPITSETVEVAGLVIDPTARTVHRDGTPIDLTRREFDLLHHFATHPGEVFSRTDLLRAVWESSPDWQDPSTVTVHIRRLRAKVEDEPSSPVHLVTQWGVGYRFDP